MHRSISSLISFLLCCIVGFAAAQERVKKQGPADFESTYAALGSAWQSQQYGLAMQKSRELIDLISHKRSEAILAAMPAPPEGYEVVPVRKPAQAAPSHPMAGMQAAVGTVVEHKYRPTGGGRTIDVTLTADSPLGQMFQMWVTNPAALGADAELIKYEAYSGVLRKQGNGWNLQILIGSDLCEVVVQDRDDEFLLGWVNQAAVDALATALGK
jgi:hypothetical protein